MTFLVDGFPRGIDDDLATNDENVSQRYSPRPVSQSCQLASCGMGVSDCLPRPRPKLCSASEIFIESSKSEAATSLCSRRLSVEMY